MNIIKKIIIIFSYALAGFIAFSCLYDKAMQIDREARPWMYKRHWEIKNGLK